MKIDYSLYLVTDENISDIKSVIGIVSQAIQGGVTIVQLREKKLSTRKFIERAVELKKLLSSFNIPLIINDRVDVALAAEADGVHIGQDDMSFEYIKKIVPHEMIIGLSVENMEQAYKAENYDIDYLAISPVFATPTKINFNEQPWGLDGIRKLRDFSKHNLVAIGGINFSNAKDVITAGADGLAVVSAICSSDNPAEAAKQLKEIIVKWKNP